MRLWCGALGSIVDAKSEKTSLRMGSKIKLLSIFAILGKLKIERRWLAEQQTAKFHTPTDQMAGVQVIQL